MVLFEIKICWYYRKPQNKVIVEQIILNSQWAWRSDEKVELYFFMFYLSRCPRLNKYLQTWFRNFKLSSHHQPPPPMNWLFPPKESIWRTTIKKNDRWSEDRREATSGNGKIMQNRRQKSLETNFKNVFTHTHKLWTNTKSFLFATDIFMPFPISSDQSKLLKFITATLLQ